MRKKVDSDAAAEGHGGVNEIETGGVQLDICLIRYSPLSLSSFSKHGIKSKTLSLQRVTVRPAKSYYWAVNVLFVLVWLGCMYSNK